MNKLIALFCLVFSGAVFSESRSALEQVDALREQAALEGWTFDVGYNEVLESKVEDATGLQVPTDWEARLGWDDIKEMDVLPWKYDWRKIDGGLPEIKNQGQCGSCWAFGTVAVLESLVKIHNGNVTPLSEQQLVSCSNCGTCSGGYFCHQFHETKGAAKSSDFPYTAKNSACKAGLQPDQKLIRWSYIGGGHGKRPTVKQLKTAIFKYGPIAVTVTANSAMMAYRRGVFNACSNSQINHLVNIVGWDDYEGVWIMRNSWGRAWGELGYMRIKYGCSRIGETATYAVYR